MITCRYYFCCSAMHGLNLKAEDGNIRQQDEERDKGKKGKGHSCCF